MLVRNGLQLTHDGPPGVASHAATGRCSAASTLTPKCPVSSTASWNRASRSTQNRTSGGSNETVVKEFTVIAWSWDPVRAETTATPVA